MKKHFRSKVFLNTIKKNVNSVVKMSRFKQKTPLDLKNKIIGRRIRKKKIYDFKIKERRNVKMIRSKKN